ncbi:MAG: hypothetical protein HS122_14750 [Opitutaceae bacterium]|nr:hypothetical protein [Opitutaceae bacterium]
MKRRTFITTTGIASLAGALIPSTASSKETDGSRKSGSTKGAERGATPAEHRGENCVYPAAALAVIDVTKAPYHCDNQGRKDCTEALIRALDDILRPTLEAEKALEKEMADDPRQDFHHPISVETLKANGRIRVVFPARPEQSRILYFPNGTYLVSDTLCYTFADLHNTSGGELNRQIIIRGQSERGAVIRLKDACPGFERGSNKPVFSFMRKSTSNVSMANLFENISIDTGIGNPGASGLRFFGNNMAAVRHVTIRSGDPGKVGAVGLLCDRHNLSGCYFKHVTVEGFDYGIQALPYRMYTVFEHITLSHQKIAGFLVDETPVSIRGLRSRNQVPALTIAGSPAHVVLVDSELAFESDPTDRTETGGAVPAIEHINGVLFARNVRTSGYPAAIGRFDSTLLSGPIIEEHSSHGVQTLRSEQEKRSLNLRIEETPEIPWEQDMNRWVSVNEFGAKGDGTTDCTQAIQSALDSGKSVIYFQPGRYLINGAIRVPATVERINFMFCDLVSGENLKQAKNRGTFRVDGESSTPLLIEDLFAFEEFRGEQYLVEHASRRTLVLSDLHAQTGAMYLNTVSGGKVFIENICCTDQFPPNPNCYQFKGQSVWARQLNPERANPEVINDGSQLWVLGFKTEGRGVGFLTKNGGSTEVLGGVVNFGGNDNPFVINDESSVSISCASNGKSNFLHQAPFASEKINGRERVLLKSSLPKRILFQGAGPFREGGQYSEQTHVPLYVGKHRG